MASRKMPRDKIPRNSKTITPPGVDRGFPWSRTGHYSVTGATVAARARCRAWWGCATPVRLRGWLGGLIRYIVERRDEKVEPLFYWMSFFWERTR